jgi:uncharacterized membrane protein
MNSNTKRQQAKWERWMKIGRSCGCHQLQSRSFFYKNFQFPVCARCTGILIGQLIVAPLSLFLGFNHFILNLLLLLMMVIDGSLQYFKILESNNIRRLVTGIMGGYAMFLLTVSILTYLWRILFY